MEDLNEFGRKSNKRHKSLDGRSKSNNPYNPPKVRNCVWQNDVSETSEEDWSSSGSIKSKGKSISKISTFYNKLYSDLFERPIRMKQIKEKSRRNIKSLGDDPINEDSNDGNISDKSGEQQSDLSSSNVSFKRHNIHALFDNLDMPKKTLSLSGKFYELSEDTILEEKGEYPQDTYDAKSEIAKFKTRHDRRIIFDKFLDRKEKYSNKGNMKLRSISFDNEPILEDKDEDLDQLENKLVLSHLGQ